MPFNLFQTRVHFPLIFVMKLNHFCSLNESHINYENYALSEGNKLDYSRDAFSVVAVVEFSPSLYKVQASNGDTTNNLCKLFGYSALSALLTFSEPNQSHYLNNTNKKLSEYLSHAFIDAFTLFSFLSIWNWKRAHNRVG